MACMYVRTCEAGVYHNTNVNMWLDGLRISLVLNIYRGVSKQKHYIHLNVNECYCLSVLYASFATAHFLSNSSGQL